jgi:hypothetical protein
MLKKAVQQGRNERRGEGAYASVRLASSRRENAAGGLFQHPDREAFPFTNNHCKGERPTRSAAL